MTRSVLLASACAAGVVASRVLRTAATSVADEVVHVASDVVHVAADVVHHAAESMHHHAAKQGTPARSVFGWWEIIQHGNKAELKALLSPKWWLQYIEAEFQAEPAHVIVEVACIVIILYLLFWRKPSPMQQDKLSPKVSNEGRVQTALLLESTSQSFLAFSVILVRRRRRN
jgi:hypothetical protein